jgi:drug/metabolite transporter (DMT)-like permease
VGIGVAIVGVAFAGWEPGAPGARRRLSTGAGLALLAAVAFGSSGRPPSAAADDPYWATFILRIASSLLVLAALLRFAPAAAGPGCGSC